METTTEIQESNRLIAEFMGLDVLYDKLVKHISVPGNMVTVMKYHESWDWIMPVVEKIEGLGFAVEISESYCCIKDGSSILIDFGGGDYTKLSATYKAVSSFIYYFNQNIKWI